jgi:ferredoxin
LLIFKNLIFIYLLNFSLLFFLYQILFQIKINKFNVFCKFVSCLIKKFNKMAYKINENECTACGTCAGDCPVEAIIPGDVYTIDPAICTDCGTCSDSCPMSAINPD